MKEKLEIELRIVQELESFLRPQTAQEKADLEQNILENGLQQPITYWRDGIIIDGHHRYHLCKKHGIPLRYVEVKQDLNTIDEVKLWMRKNQLTGKGRKYTEQEERAERVAVVNEEVRLGKGVHEAVTEAAKASGLTKRTIYREIRDEKAISSLSPKVKVLAGGENEIRRMKRPAINALAKMSPAEQEDILERHDGDVREVERELSKRRPPRQEKRTEAPADIIGEPNPERVKPTKEDKERAAKRPAAKALREALEHLAKANKAMYEAKDAVVPSLFASWRQRMIDLDHGWSEFIEEHLHMEGKEPKESGEKSNPFF